MYNKCSDEIAFKGAMCTLQYTIYRRLYNSDICPYLVELYAQRFPKFIIYLCNYIRLVKVHL